MKFSLGRLQAMLALVPIECQFAKKLHEIGALSVALNNSPGSPKDRLQTAGRWIGRDMDK
jgi:hypothetical protein